MLCIQLFIRLCFPLFLFVEKKRNNKNKVVATVVGVFNESSAINLKDLKKKIEIFRCIGTGKKSRSYFTEQGLHNSALANFKVLIQWANHSKGIVQKKQ